MASKICRVCKESITAEPVHLHNKFPVHRECYHKL